MSLYHFDADGDGKRDTIYRHQFDYTGHYFAVADFKTCSLTPIIGQRATANLFQFEGKSFVISDIHLGSVSVYRINNLASKIDANYPTCYFSEINQFTDYRANKLLINQLKYRR